ncbi:hypothetical protein [Halalkalibacter okhensis]|uniref:Uncharacterized protein n=1 Tax=Halalkalibacter okhensis TaxID=333138 RepID=A0A0B0ICS7_9BACI|nr:hypothetical protein [Halalkalibacter okhensis]KHF37834.1 hypothetical protein LQ50_25165 [Halalkalibacter okhensis]
MNKDQQEHMLFLEEQLRWAKEQDRILANIEDKLYEMKKIAEYASEHSLSALEVEKLNSQLNGLKEEIQCLEKQLQPMVH